MSTFQTIVLAKRPGFGPVVANETFSSKNANRKNEKDLKEGEFEVQTLYLSLDPAMRGWLNGMF